MELEFDKEMDALLRKARSGTSVAKPAGIHLDADAIAAFAEGAIPDAVRKTYTAHFADCDSCRKVLSHVALLNEPEAMKAVAATAARAPAAIPVPWYSSLLRSPGLAAAFGLLVLTFGGVLVYVVTQRNSNDASTVAMYENKPAATPVPYAGIDSNSNAASTSAISNAAANTSNMMSNASRAATNSSANTVSKNGPTTLDGVDTASGGSFGQSSPSGTTTVQPPAASAPAPSDLPINGRNTRELALDKPKTATEERKQDKDEDQKETVTTRNRAAEDDRLARGDSSAKKAIGGPSRAAGPVQNQMQINSATSEMAVTRRVGGKTFHNSNGAWYDNAYHGQSTTNVRRGTDDFKKLDSGLRSIANDLGGVVVVVWKDKAYRIQ